MKTTALLLSALPFFLTAQSWSWVRPIDGTGNESSRSMQVLPDGRLAVAGAFEGTLEIDGWQASANGEADLFLALFDANQQLDWAIAAGGSQDDEINSITILPSGDIACLGSFWFEMELGDTMLTSGSSPRALFAARFSPEGALRWAQRFSGQGLKGAAGIAARPDGSLLLAGFFEQTLELGALTLESGATDGSTFTFVAALAADGQLLWTKQEGQQGDTRATALALLPDGGLAVGGFFNDTTLIGGQQLTANTSDRDVFLAGYDADGAARWARKAGGVFDDELTALASDEEGNIYGTGYFVGVMAFSQDISIQSMTGNSDFYLFRYNAEGDPLFARALGGPQLQQGLAIAVHNGQPVIGGAFQGDMAFDGFSVSSGSTANGFLTGFNASGTARWLVTIPAGLVSLASSLAIDAEGKVFAGGNFGPSGTFDNTTLESIGPTGVFLGQLRPALTPVMEEAAGRERIFLYPNPVRNRMVYLSPADRDYDIVLSRVTGEILLRDKTRGQVHLPKGLPAGLYYLSVRASGRWSSFPLLIER